MTAVQADTVTSNYHILEPVSSPDPRVLTNQEKAEESDLQQCAMTAVGELEDAVASALNESLHLAT